MTPNTELRFFPIAIGRYRHHAPLLDIDDELGAVTDLFADFGATSVEWPTPMAERDGDATHARLDEWVTEAHPYTILYWVGHGWSNGVDAVLAHAASPNPPGANGITPTRLAEAIAARDPGEDDGWAIVIIDACRAADVVQRLSDAIDRQPGARRVLLIGTSGEHSTTLGRFREVLDRILRLSFRTDQHIRLWSLSEELKRNLPEHAEVVFKRLDVDTAVLRRTRTIQLPAGPMDVLAEVTAVLTELTEEERQHFIPKAQSAELGESFWYFQGRAAETTRITGWLHDHRCGMLVITGSAGSGKSALLGYLITQSRPALRATLARHQLLVEAPPEQRPPDNVFDVVLHLTGRSLSDTILDIGIQAGLGIPPVRITSGLEWLATAVQRRRRPITMLVDALDEATDPHATATAILRRLAAIDGVRVVVGTRASTSEQIDQPVPDRDLLDALRATADNTITVTQEPTAMGRYVRQRLTRALPTAEPELIADASVAIGAAQRPFLFARLAVHEIAADPTLLRSANLERLLTGDHRSLFTRAIARLTHINHRYRPLLHALAYGRGRGLPALGGIWAVVATAIATTNTPDAPPILDDDIAELARDAAPYLLLDREHDHTVYRLAHRAFAEHFTTDTSPTPVDQQIHHAITRHLVDTVRQGGGHLNPYLTHYLSAHAGLGGAPAWKVLADHTDLLDQLDPVAVAADAMRTAFGRISLPPAITGILGASRYLQRAAATDRPGLRQLAMTRHTTITVPADREPLRPGAWTVRWAARTYSPSHLALAGHFEGSGILAVTALTLHDGRVLLASGSHGGTISLWDPATGTPYGQPLTGHTGGVWALTALTLADRQVLLASGSNDGSVRLWDPVTGQSYGEPRRHADLVWALTAVPLPGGRRLLASGSEDGYIDVWDPSTGDAYGEPLHGHRGGVWTMTVVTLPNQRVLLVSGGADGTARLWDLASEKPHRPPLEGHVGGVDAVAPVPLPDGRLLLATGSHDRTVRLWDPVTGKPYGPPLRGHTSGVSSVTAVPAGGRVLLASGGHDSTVRLWNPATGEPHGQPIHGHSNEVSSLAVVQLPDGRVLLASGSHDGTVRLWDPDVVDDPRTAAHTSRVTAMSAVPLPGGRVMLATASHDRTIRLWDPATGQPHGQPLRGHTGIVFTASAAPLPDGRVLLATGSQDRTVRLWDPLAVLAHGDPLHGHTGNVLAVVAVPMPGGKTLLASSGVDHTIRLWDLATGQSHGQPLIGHRDIVGTLAAVPMNGRVLLASGSHDNCVRLWDPTTGRVCGDPLRGHEDWISALTALPLPDGQVLLASGSHDGTVRLWDPTTGDQHGAPLRGHNHSITALVPIPLPDGQVLIASGSRDRTIRVWHPMTGTCLTTVDICEPISAMVHLAGDSVVVALPDGVAAISLPDGTWVKT